MDVAASVVNIIQITGTLIEFLRAARQANSDRRKLLVEAHSLLALLTSLKDFVEVEDEDDFLDWRHAVRQLEVPDGPFAQYNIEMLGLLEKLCPQGRFEKATKTMLWKVAKEDVNEILLRIERLKSLTLVALEMDHVRLSEAILATVANISTTTQLIRSDTLKLVSSADEAAFRSLLDQICPEDYSSVFQSNITEHTVGIGRNFTSSSEFRGWVAGSDDGSRTLLCVGDPGVGKTVLATKAIQALRQKGKTLREAVLFVYCDCTRRRSRLSRRDSSPEARSKGVQTPGHFIASLLRQLVETNGSQTSYLQDLMSRHKQQKTKPRAKELEQAFAEVAQDFERIYIIVDAMDECDGLEMETFATHLRTICAAPTLRLLLTSRRHPGIEQIFEDSIRLDMRASDDDTLQYLRSRARREFPPRVVRDSQAIERILSALLLSANGIPLIARLHMNTLRGLRTPGAMLAAIARLRSNSDVYDETYHAAMERITKQAGELPAMAIRVIRWIVCAKRYIYTRELQCILAMGNESLSIDEDFVPDMDDIYLACEGLVCTVNDSQTDGDRLELVHTTARQYFDCNLAEWAPDVNLDLTRTCLNLLAFEDPSPLPESLMVYAWRYWGQHAKDVEDLNEEEQFNTLVSLVRKFVSSDKPGSPLSHVVTVHEKRRCLAEDGVTGYHLVAKFGLTRLFEACWESSDDLDTLLGRRDYDVNPLLEAIYSGGVEMVKVMLRLRSVDPNARNATGHNPLQIAAVLQHADIVEALLESDMADPNGVDHTGRPLVLLAACLGEERAVETILSAGKMDPTVRDEHASSLMTLAALDDSERSRFESMSLEEVKAAMTSDLADKGG